MDSAPFIKTPFENADREEEILIKKEYKIRCLTNIVKIIIEKQKIIFLLKVLIMN